MLSGIISGTKITTNASGASTGSDVAAAGAGVVAAAENSAWSTSEGF